MQRYTLKLFEGVRTFRKRFAAYILSTEGIETMVSKTLSKGFQKLSYLSRILRKALEDTISR